MESRALWALTYALALQPAAVAVGLMAWRTHPAVLAVPPAVATAAALVRRASGEDWLTALARVLALYPIVAIGLLYATWFATCAELGRRPSPLDDAGRLSPALTLLGVVGSSLAAGAAPALLAALTIVPLRIASWMGEEPPASRSAVRLAILALLAWIGSGVAAFAFLLLTWADGAGRGPGP